MSKETKRQSAGVSGRGEVFIITKVDNDISPTSAVGIKERYLVRQGAIEVGVYDSKAEAERVAKALADG